MYIVIYRLGEKTRKEQISLAFFEVKINFFEKETLSWFDFDVNNLSPFEPAIFLFFLFEQIYYIHCYISIIRKKQGRNRCLQLSSKWG